jgi:Fe-S-cluster containining protein
VQLQVLQDERFSCQSCANCCREQYVELFAGEPERIAALPWPKTDPLHGLMPMGRHGGRIYLAHRPDGSCVFLNQSNRLCRIHEQFGAEAKPMACRIFPFQITPTFAGEASVSARYDCPTIRANQGSPHADALPLLQRYTGKWPEPDGFSDATCCHLDRDQISAVADFLTTMLGAFKRNDQKVMFIAYLCDVLSTTAADELDRPALASVFAPLKLEIDAISTGNQSKPGLLHRMAFRTLLALHLRRDEDVLDGRDGRLSRVVAMTAFVFGFGSFRGLGLYHPPGSLQRAGLFNPAAPAPDAESFALFWRWIGNKLQAFQFMGHANGNRDFLNGLRSLTLAYPLVVAAARHHAASRNSAAIEAADVDYAVAAIDHSFGRTSVVSGKFLRSIEMLLLERSALLRLISTV